MGSKTASLKNPRRCKFDPKTVECQVSDGPACLTAPQVEAARRIYSGPINPRTKKSIYPGMLPGSELGWDSERGLQPFGIGESYFRFPVFNNAAWDYRTMDFDNTIAKINQMHATLMNAMDTDNPRGRAHATHGQWPCPQRETQSEQVHMCGECNATTALKR